MPLSAAALTGPLAQHNSGYEVESRGLYWLLCRDEVAIVVQRVRGHANDDYALIFFFRGVTMAWKAGLDDLVNKTSYLEQFKVHPINDSNLDFYNDLVRKFADPSIASSEAPHYNIL